MTVQTDAQGRIYLTSELRERYGERFHVVEYADRIELVPIEEDSLGAVREEIGDSLSGTSNDRLRGRALERAKEEAESDVGRHEESGEDESE